MDLLFKYPAYFIETYFSFSPIGFLIALVGFFVVLAVLCRKRFSKVGLRWLYIIAASLYLATLVGITLLSVSRADVRVLHWNPVDNIRELFDEDMGVHQLRGCLSNIILFVPLGVFSSVYFKKHKVVFSLLVGFVTATVVEVLQYALHRGCAETMDVICNTMGALLGAAVTAAIMKLIDKKHRIKE